MGMGDTYLHFVLYTIILEKNQFTQNWENITPSDKYLTIHVHCENIKFFVFDIFIWILYITSKELENLWTMSEVSGAELNLCINAQVTIGALEPLVHVLTLLKLHLLFTCNWFHSVNQIVFLIQFAWLKWLLSLFVIKSNLHKIIQFSLFHHLPLTFLCKQYCLQGNPCIWLFKYCYV